MSGKFIAHFQLLYKEGMGVIFFPFICSLQIFFEAAVRGSLLPVLVIAFGPSSDL